MKHWRPEDRYSKLGARWIAASLFGFFFVLYGLTMASVWDLPTVFAMDGAELVLACRDLGVDHPPGHPLYLLLGFLLSHLPSRSPDQGVIALSVLAGAGTVPMVFLGTLELTRDRASALLAGLTLGLSGIFWLHSTIVEVYALQLFLLATFTWLQLRTLGHRQPKLIFWVMLALGLTATSNILLAVLLAPGTLLFFLTLRTIPSPRPARFRLTRAIAGLVAGLLPFLYLPWRLSSTSYVNDILHITGYPIRSLRWYLWYLSGWEFVGNKVAKYSLAEIPGLLWQYLESAGHNLTPLIILLALAGTVVVLIGFRGFLSPKNVKKKHTLESFIQPAMGGLVLLGFLATALPVIGYQVEDREVFYLPSFLFLVYLAGLGASWLSTAIPRARFLLLALPIVVLAWSLPVGWKFVVPITSDTSTYEARLERYQALPRDAVIIGYDDGFAARYRYFDLVRGLRPDIAVETFARHAPRYQGALPEAGSSLTQRDLRAGLQMVDRYSALKRLAKQYTGRPLFLILADEAPAEFPGYRFRRAPMDPRLLALEPRRETEISAAPIPSVISLDRDWYPSDVHLEGWTLKGLDGAGSTTFLHPLRLGAASINGLILRGELFELSIVVRRLNQKLSPYFALFSFLDGEGKTLESPIRNFTASRQLQVLNEETPTGHYQQSSFDFKIPRACPMGPVTLAIKLYLASDEVVGEYKGKPIRKMSLVIPSEPWAGQQEFVPLGTLQVQ